MKYHGFLRNKAGRPILLLVMQTCNSSAGVPAMLERELRAVELFSGNALEAPVYWFRTEQEPGRFPGFRCRRLPCGQ